MHVDSRNVRPEPIALPDDITYLSDWIEPHRRATNALLTALLAMPAPFPGVQALSHHGHKGPLYDACRAVDPDTDWSRVLPVFYQAVLDTPIQLHSCLVRGNGSSVTVSLHVPDAGVMVPGVLAARPEGQTAPFVYQPPVSSEPGPAAEPSSPSASASQVQMPSLAAFREQLTALQGDAPQNPSTTRTLTTNRHRVTLNIWNTTFDDTLVVGIIHALRRSDTVSSLLTESEIAGRYARREPLQHAHGGAKEALPAIEQALGTPFVAGVSMATGKEDKWTGWSDELQWFALTATQFIHAVARPSRSTDDPFVMGSDIHTPPTPPTPERAPLTTGIPDADVIAIAQSLGTVTAASTQTVKQHGWRLTVRAWPATAFPNHSVFVAYNEYTSPFRASRPRSTLDKALPLEHRTLDHPDLFDAMDLLSELVPGVPSEGCGFIDTRGGTTTVRCHTVVGDTFLHAVATRTAIPTDAEQAFTPPELPVRASTLAKTAAIGAAVIVGGGILTILAFLLLF